MLRQDLREQTDSPTWGGSLDQNAVVWNHSEEGAVDDLGKASRASFWSNKNVHTNFWYEGDVLTFMVLKSGRHMFDIAMPDNPNASSTLTFVFPDGDTVAVTDHEVFKSIYKGLMRHNRRHDRHTYFLRAMLARILRPDAEYPGEARSGEKLMGRPKYPKIR